MTMCVNEHILKRRVPVKYTKKW